jgi:flagellar hook assembly protein FlgD/PKD repeat protein/lysophospholipase L1-like esterase
MLSVRGRAAWPVVLRGASSALAMMVIVLVAAAVAGAQTAAPPNVSTISTDRAFSPNGDGQEDQASVTYQLLLPSRITVTITDENSDVVRTVDGGTDRPAGSFAFDWDGRTDGGTTASDGRYGYRIAATSAAGDTTNAVGTIYLDSRIAARFTAPAAGDTVTGPVAVQVKVADGLTLSYAQASVVHCHWYWLDCQQVALGPDIDGGATLNLNSNSWYSGANGIDGYVDYLDQLGQSHRYTLPRLALTVRRPAHISDVSPDRAFSPDGDGQDDQATVSYELWTAAHVDVIVRDADGERVRQLEAGASHSEGGQSFAWDGRDDGGDQVSAGEYTYVITAQGAFGDPATASGRIGVDRRRPATIVQPITDAQLSGVTRVRVAPADGLTLTYATFSVDRCENPYFTGDIWGSCQAYAQTIDADESMAADLNTDAWYSGANKVYASVNYLDTYGQSHSYAIPGTAVAVPRAVRITDVSADRYFSPDADSYDDIASTSYWLSEDSQTTVTIADADGRPVRTVETDVPRSAGGYHYFTWDGGDDDGTVVTDGIYSYRITATPDDGSDPASVTGRIGVDTRVPAHVTAPVSGASLTGPAHVRAVPADGLTLTDEQVSIDNCENPYLNGIYWGNCNAYAYPPGDAHGGLTADLDTGSWRAGPVGVTVTVGFADPFGQSHRITLPPVAVNVPRDLHIENVSPPRTFSPDSDGQEDISDLSFWLSGDAATTITVARADGGVVRTLESGAARTYGTQYVTWDGRDDDGHVVPDGSYTYKISGRPASGATATAAVDVGVATRVPATFARPAAGEALSGSIQVRVTPRDGLVLTALQTAADCEDPYLNGPYWGNCNAYGAEPLSDGSLAVDMNTDSWIPGDSHISATVWYTDAFGQSHSYTLPSLPVSVPRAERITDVTGDRYIELGTESSTSVSYRLATAAETTIVVHDADGTIVRHLESGQARSAGLNSFTWDGLDDDGTLLPDGVYTYIIDSRPAAGDPATFSGRIGLDRRAPGTFQTPQDGDTVSGVAQLVFVPRSDIATQSVDFCVDRNLANRCVSVFGSPGADPWRTSRDTLDLPDGDLTVIATIGYADAFDQPHSTTLSRSVLVDNTTPSAELSVTPSAGTAPLQAALRIAAYQPRGATLDYTIDFGDGAATAIGTIAAPYPTVNIAHAFATPGTYHVRATVSDGHGHAAKRTQDVTVTAPTINHAPTATLAIDHTTGTAPIDATVTVSGTDEDDDALTYALDFGDDETASGDLPQAALHHTYNKAGSYLVRLTVSDGEGAVIRTTRVDVVLAEPLKAAAGDDQTVAAGDAVDLDSSGSRPSVGIERYHWTFGDGTSDEDGARVDHTYNNAGTYTATLTVTAGGHSESDTATITVVDPSAAPSIAVTVTDDAHVPLSGTQVLVITADGRRFSAISDGTGRAALDDVPDGSYTFYAYKSGYRPDTGTLRVADGSGSGAIALTSGQIATTQLNSHRMTRDEIVAAGIDPNDPANQHVFQFEIHLAFRPSDSPIVFQGYTTGGGGGGAGGFYGASFGGSPCTAVDFCRGTIGGTTYEVHVVWIDDEPMLQWLVIPGKAKFLKEFFDISMIVQNLGAPAFTLESGHAQLSLPQGLNLAPTPAPQSLGVSIGDIPGGRSASVHWLVRGDAEGSYSPSASYSGLLQPIAVPVSLHAELAEPFKVWGGSALKMIVDTDGSAVAHEPYRLRVGLQNVADVPVYNPSIELLKKDKLNYIYQPRERLEQSADAIDPGETFWADYVLVPKISGTLVLDKSFVKKTGGDVSLESEIRSHARTTALDLSSHGRKDAVVLDWATVPGAEGYAVYRTPDDETDFADQPLNARFLKATKAIVPADPASGHQFYAVSPLVDGKPDMRHPMIAEESRTVDIWPSSEVKDFPCSQRPASLSVSFEDPDFDLTDYEIRFGDGDPVTGTLGGFDATAHVPLPQYSIDTGVVVHARARNSEGQWGPQTDLRVGRCDYVALGDSFSSGEGNGDYYADSETDRCHRAQGRAYPELLHADPAAPAEAHGKYQFVACSGAVTSAFYNTNNGEPAQTEALSEETDLVTVTFGGNDLGFKDILLSCAGLGVFTGTIHVSCQPGWSEKLDRRITEIPKTLHALYSAIRAKAPHAPVYVLAYPPMFPDGRLTGCQGVLPWDVNWMHGEWRKANDAIKRATDGVSDVHYVDLDTAFRGHDICSDTTPWFNQLTTIPVDGIPTSTDDLSYLFHPNAYGHIAMEEALLAAMGRDSGRIVPIALQQTIFHPVDVADHAARLALSIHWPGSDVELSLISPSGRVIDRATQAEDVEHIAGPTYESYIIANPEPGQWQYKLYGKDLPPGGEDVVVEDAVDAAPGNQVPSALYTVDAYEGTAGDERSFDARSSYDDDGTVTAYHWDFGDGTTATGPTAKHVYQQAGHYTVTLEVTDDDGTTDTFSDTPLTISAKAIDTTPPVLHDVPGDRVAEATAPSGTAFAFATPTATDDVDGAIPVTCAPASGATFAIAVTTVTCTAHDAAGNEAKRAFGVTVRDTTAPTLRDIPSDITATATDAQGSIITYSSATATDTVDGAVPVTCAPASGATFAVGDATVHCTASDAHGNTVSGTFGVHVAPPPAPPADRPLADLQQALAGPGVPKSVQTKLKPDLAGVAAAIDDDHVASACAALSKFDDDLDAVSRQLSASVRADLRAKAGKLRAALDCADAVRLIGRDGIGTFEDHDDAGMAEAFRATAERTGTMRVLTVRLTKASTAKKLIVGLYANSGQHPGKLLTTGAVSSPEAGWADIALPATELKAGTRYWIALLSPRGAGTVRFVDRCCSSSDRGPTETSKSTKLVALPLTWAGRNTYNDGMLSAFGHP